MNGCGTQVICCFSFQESPTLVSQGGGIFFSYLLLIQPTLKPASLLDFIEQVFIETRFVSGIILGIGDINGVQTDKVFAFMELIA